MRRSASCAWIVLLAAGGWIWYATAPEEHAVAPPATAATEEPAHSSPDSQVSPPSRYPAGTGSPDREAKPQPAQVTASRSPLETSLLDLINRDFFGKSEGLIAYGNGVSDETIVSDKDINPEGKALGGQRTRDVAAIIARHREAQKLLGQRERTLSGDALLSAVATGQYIASEPSNPIAGSADRAAMVQEAQRQGAQQRDFLARTQEMLSGRFGVPMRDWACSLLSTNLPNGTGHSTVIYYTLQQAPDLFACRKAISDDMVAERAELRQYFASIPK